MANWGLNFLVKILGGFFSALGILTFTGTSNPGYGWQVFFFTLGLALLFAPAIER